MEQRSQMKTQELAAGSKPAIYFRRKDTVGGLKKTVRVSDHMGPPQLKTGPLSMFVS
jgi:hypothetical protein